MTPDWSWAKSHKHRFWSPVKGTKYPENAVVLRLGAEYGRDLEGTIIVCFETTCPKHRTPQA